VALIANLALKLRKSFFSNYFNGFETSIKFCVFWILISKKLKQLNFGVIEYTMSTYIFESDNTNSQEMANSFKTLF